MKNKFMIMGCIILILGSIIWGFEEHQEKKKLAQQIDNQYQRAYHELSSNIDLLHDKIGATLAMGTNDSLSPALTEVWKIATASQTNVGQLPLTLFPIHHTQQFLSNVGNFTYQIAMRDLKTNPLSAEEYHTLRTMYVQADNVENTLRDMQDNILDKN